MSNEARPARPRRGMASEGRDIEYNITMKELPEGERPRERLTHYGASSLSTAELIAIVLRTGSLDENAVRLGQRLLTDFGGLPGLAQAPASELMRCKGIGPVKAVELRAAFELGRRLLVTAPEARPQVKSPADAANLLLGEMSLLEQECTWSQS